MLQRIERTDARRVPPARLLRWLMLAPLTALLAPPVLAQFERDPAEVAATRQDYAETLKRLGIAALRPGADGYNRQALNAVNYDEGKAEAGALPLPEPLKMGHGRPVTSAAMWWRQRRPELVRLFDEQVYGKVPPTAPAIRWEVLSSTSEVENGVPVLTRRLLGHAGEGSAAPVAIQLRITVPARATGPVPLILAFGFPEGFHFPGVTPPPPGASWTDLLVARGWGHAVIVANSIQADNGAGLSRGVIGLSLAGRRRAADDWGVLRAWAWGASRAIDWLSRDPAIDRQRIGIEGLSRYGKAALVAMAYDQRIAIGLIGSSGAGGTKPLRRDFGERIGNLAAADEYHWFAPNFLLYAGPNTVADLPVDSDELIALAAPRPLFISAGKVDGDGWVDPEGSFLAAAAAGPVWRLLGARGLSQGRFPQTGEAVAGGDLAFRQHFEGHTDAPNWPLFLDFAAREFAGKSVGGTMKSRWAATMEKSR